VSADVKLQGISSMATKMLLADVVKAYRATQGVEITIESVGGVVAVDRVKAQEPFDLVMLASGALDKLIAEGLVRRKVVLAYSDVAIAVPQGGPDYDISSEGALRETLLAVETIGYSTGPSGDGLLKLFDTWGASDILREKLIQAPAGRSVGTLVADGTVKIGFQQYSELFTVPGIKVLGLMPKGCEIITTFSAGVGAASQQAAASGQFIDYLESADLAEIKRQNGMR
jgi:molybdate transport system substrate-binding protein